MLFNLAMIEQHIKYDPFLQIHTKYYVREIRIAAYNQILESYRSLTMESMAKSFGVSEDFIDSYLPSHFYPLYFLIQ